MMGAWAQEPTGARLPAPPAWSRDRLPVLASVLLIAGHLTMVACGGEPLRCGDGTVEKDGKCVPLPGPDACGAGTVRSGTTCLPDGDAVGAPDGGGGQDAGVADTGAGIDTGAVVDAGANTDAVEDAGDDAHADAGGDAVADGLADALPGDGVALPDAATVCVAQCVGKVCGPDGCGGSCGKCSDPGAPYCDELTGTCAAQCVPSCVGKSCGPDGCGGSCGTCAAGLDCSASGHCAPGGWACDPGWYDADDACDCGCGAPDPDCKDSALPLSGCALLQKCDDAGACVDLVPAAWTCAQTAYGSGDQCDCGCGVPDPDCANPKLLVAGCGPGSSCATDGTCKACSPDCKDKACGGDGCGGLCGVCTGGKACDAGVCVDPCSPKALVCQNAQCGDDGCGGSCGSCAAGTTCKAGSCAPADGGNNPFSCKGYCGSKAPGGCSCTSGCAALGTCCPDAGKCACQKNCTGKTCGSDGCGGVCGSCSGAEPYCGANGVCTATCKPSCGGKQCGDDGCGGTCGACDGDAWCASNAVCVPKTWTCDAGLYGDSYGCDCGCGAVDSDCKQGAATFGCPKVSTKCTDKALCDVSFCTSNAQCPNAWCTGAYVQGSGKMGGVCAAPASNLGPPGTACQISEQCASSLCIDGLCRAWCQGDADCPPEQVCGGLAVAYGGQTSAGFASVCMKLFGNAAPCKAQADCAPTKQRCIALVDPKTLAPRFVCAMPQSTKPVGGSCATTGCPSGQFCAHTGKAFVCTTLCPGGAADCPSGWTCADVPFHNAGTVNPADDPKVAACTPK